MAGADPRERIGTALHALATELAAEKRRVAILRRENEMLRAEIEALKVDVDALRALAARAGANGGATDAAPSPTGKSASPSRAG